MAVEIERKFLLCHDGWRDSIEKTVAMRQGYLGGNAHSSIRVRLEDDKAALNIKHKLIGIQHQEFDYVIPGNEATQLLTLCDRPLIEKKRHLLHYADKLWEIDEFEGENQGLIVAEIELAAANEEFSLPNWVGAEVTDDVRYYNICLVNKPYSKW